VPTIAIEVAAANAEKTTREILEDVIVVPPIFIEILPRPIARQAFQGDAIQKT
jgi:hypothetical protein